MSKLSRYVLAALAALALHTTALEAQRKPPALDADIDAAAAHTRRRPAVCNPRPLLPEPEWTTARGLAGSARSLRI